MAIGTNPAVKEIQAKDFRTWHDSTGLHRQEAALVDCKAGVVRLSSSDGILLEIPESDLSEDDLGYVRSQGYGKGQQKVTFYFVRVHFRSLI